MAKQDVSKRHSETALFAAMCRAVAAKDGRDVELGPDHLAADLLPPHVRFFIRFEKVRMRFKHKNQVMTPGGYEYLLARTAYFDERFKQATQDRVRQIVLLGAGYDTRAFRLAGTNSVSKVFELDAPGTQRIKIQRLKKAEIQIPDGHVFTPIDFNRDSVGGVLEEAGFDPGLHTLFLWEGVSMYLEPESVAATLSFVASNEGNCIVFDYVNAFSKDNIDDFYGAATFMETWRKHRANEPFQYSLEAQELEPLLNQHGLRLVEHLDSKEMHRRYLQDADSDWDQITGFFHLVTAVAPAQV